MNQHLAVELRSMRFAWPGSRQPLLNIDRFSVNGGEKVFVKGPSGCGKTTLLNLIGGILSPQQGSIHVLGVDMCALSEREPRSLSKRAYGNHFSNVQFDSLPLRYGKCRTALLFLFETKKKRAGEIIKSPCRSGSFNAHAENAVGGPGKEKNV